MTELTVNCESIIKKLEKANNDIDRYKRSGALHDFLTGMWQTGYDRVKHDYDSAVTLEGNPANEGTTVTAAPKWHEDGFDLIASGTDILFLEFGTGVNQSFTHPWGAQFGYTPASYSEKHHGFLIEPRLRHFHGQWPHDRTLHWGQNPARGMYNASKAMEWYARITPLRIF